MDKLPIILVFVGAAITAILTAGFGTMVNLSMTPQFEIEYEQWNRTTDCDKLGIWEKFGECPEDSSSRVIDIEKTTVKNTGLVQAKNVEIDLSTYGEGIITNVECPEGEMDTEIFKNSHKIKFNRFSQDIVCKFDYETVENSRIDVITITADDSRGKQFTVQDSYYSQIIPFVLSLIVIMAVISVLLIGIAYLTLQAVKEILRRRQFKIPMRYKDIVCDFQFETLISETEEKAKEESIRIQDDWFSKIKQISKNISTSEIENGNYIRNSLTIKNTNVFIDIRKNISKQNRGKLFVVTNARVTTKDRSIMQKILNEGEMPCWTYSCILHNEYDVDNLVKKINEKSGKHPSNNAFTKVGDEIEITDATYNILRLENGEIRVNFSKGNGSGKITLVFDGEENNGFYKIIGFRISEMILMASGDRTLDQSLKIIKNALKIPKNLLKT